MARTTANIQVTLKLEVIKWLEKNHIKKSTLINELIEKYIEEFEARLK